MRQTTTTPTWGQSVTGSERVLIREARSGLLLLLGLGLAQLAGPNVDVTNEDALAIANFYLPYDTDWRRAGVGKICKGRT